MFAPALSSIVVLSGGDGGAGGGHNVQTHLQGSRPLSSIPDCYDQLALHDQSV